MFYHSEMPKFVEGRGQKIGSRYARLLGQSGASYYVTEVSALSVFGFRDCVLIAENRGEAVGVWHSNNDTAFARGSGSLADVEARFGANVRWFVYFLGYSGPDAIADLVPGFIDDTVEPYDYFAKIAA